MFLHVRAALLLNGQRPSNSERTMSYIHNSDLWRRVPCFNRPDTTHVAACVCAALRLCVSESWHSPAAVLGTVVLPPYRASPSTFADLMRLGWRRHRRGSRRLITIPYQRHTS